MATGEKVVHYQNNVSNYNLFLYSSHIKLNLYIYSYVPLVDQLTPMGIPLSASIGTQKHKDFNYPFIASCQV